jgi:anthranilate phosphoribosyltransferase
LARLYQYLFQKTTTQFTILYTLEGYDEISLTGPTKALSQNSERILTPQDFGVQTLQAKEISGGADVASSAKIFMEVLQNKGTQAQQNVVCANAGMALATALNLSPIEGFEKAKESLVSGAALKAFTELQNLSKA